MYEDYYGSDDGFDPYTAYIPQVMDMFDFSGLPEDFKPVDTGGSLADVLAEDIDSQVPTDDRADINAIIEAGNGYDVDLGFLKNIPSGLWKTVKGMFVDDKGNVNYSGLAKLGTAAAGLYGLTSKKDEVGGYNKPVPKLTAVREQIQYDDPNRRPGSAGRQYFTDTQYVPQGDAAALEAARTAAGAQATGIKALQPQATAEVNPWAGKMKMPALKPFEQTAIAKEETAAGLPAIPNRLDIAKETYPEKFTPAEGDQNFMGPVSGSQSTDPSRITNTMQPVRLDSPDFKPTFGLAAGGQAKMNEPRYLRGITDGMEDRINTSIDDKQPAKLSHGEFVIPADVVSHLGNGNSDAGAKKLYQMMDRVRQARTGTKQQGKQINPDKFMPGGLAQLYAGGGEVQAFQEGGSAGVTGGSGGVPLDTSKTSTLSPWVGDFVTNALGQGAALAAQPYQAYTGPLTAGASDLQKQAFAGASEMAQTGYTPTQFKTGTFDTQAASQYMNPYLQASLDPQLRELRRQSQISNLGTLAKAGASGIMGGARRDLMEAENMRNLLGKQSDVLGAGYATAYDKAREQFNTQQQREMEAQKASEASRQYGSEFGLKSLDALTGLGKTQRDIAAEGVAADKAQFEEQRDYPFKMPQYQLSLLGGLPIGAQTTATDQSGLAGLMGNISGLATLYKTLSALGQAPAK